MSKRWEKGPEVTPDGKPVKVGVVVATPAVPRSGTAVQQWMCEAVSELSRPVNVTSTSMVFTTWSIVTVANPVPVDRLGGDSLEPFKIAKYEMGAENATDPKSRPVTNVISATFI